MTKQHTGDIMTHMMALTKLEFSFSCVDIIDF